MAVRVLVDDGDTVKVAEGISVSVAGMSVERSVGNNVAVAAKTGTGVGSVRVAIYPSQATVTVPMRLITATVICVMVFHAARPSLFFEFVFLFLDFVFDFVSALSSSPLLRDGSADIGSVFGTLCLFEEIFSLSMMSS